MVSPTMCHVRQLCYRAFVLGLVQCPADYLAWRTMSRTQALPQRGQGSKDTVFSLCFPKTFTSCIMCQLSVVLCRGRRGGERGVDMPLSGLCSFSVALQGHDSIHLVWEGHTSECLQEGKDQTQPCPAQRERSSRAAATGAWTDKYCGTLLRRVSIAHKKQESVLVPAARDKLSSCRCDRQGKGKEVSVVHFIQTQELRWRAIQWFSQRNSVAWAETWIQILT